MIVPVIVFQLSIQLLNLALQIYLTEVSNLQTVTQNLGVGLLGDIFRISDFFWKLGGGNIIEHGTILGSLQVNAWMKLCDTAMFYNRVQKWWCHRKLFLDFSVLDTMYRWSMMKNIHSPNWVGIGSWGPKIWPHEYLISPWNQCKLAWFQTVMNQANLHWFQWG